MRNARRFPNMEVVNAAVADFDGTALLVPGGEDTSTFHVVASPRGGPALSEVGQAAPHVVPVLGLDSWSEKGDFPDRRREGGCRENGSRCVARHGHAA
jgi:hypothetical protein